MEYTLIVADAINRFILRSVNTPEVQSEWNTVRRQLNALATAYGHPVLADTIVAVREVGNLR